MLLQPARNRSNSSSLSSSHHRTMTSATAGPHSPRESSQLLGHLGKQPPTTNLSAAFAPAGEQQQPTTHRYHNNNLNNSLSPSPHLYFASTTSPSVSSSAASASSSSASSVASSVDAATSAVAAMQFRSASSTSSSNSTHSHKQLQKDGASDNPQLSATESGHRHQRQLTSHKGGSLEVDCSQAFDAVVPYSPPTVLFADVLLVKKKLFGGFERKFFFLLQGISDLFTCRDEAMFDKWISLGKLLDAECPASIRPERVLRILRATRDTSVNEQAITIVTERINQPNKLQYKTFYAENKQSMDKWMHALQQVQVSKRTHKSPGHSHSHTHLHAHHAHGHAMGSTGSGASDIFGSMSPRTQATNATFTTVNSSPRACSRRGSFSREKGSTTVGSVRSYRSDSSASNSVRGDESVRNENQEPTAASGNVTLFVPTTGTTIANSESKIALAKKELEALLQKPDGAAARRLPDRGLPSSNNSKDIAWRYGFPDYLFTDLTYLKGKTHDHDVDSTEYLVETLCQTFSMEATHKKQYSQWNSVVPEFFTIRVNDSAKLPGDLIQENDLFGLLLFNKSISAKIPNLTNHEEKPPAVVLAEAFTEGFPFEVLDVYTQPPVCHFAWRQWGRFTGQFKGKKGDGSLLEIRGFGRMTMKSHKLLGLYLFFKPNEIFEALEMHIGGNKKYARAGSPNSSTQDQRKSPVLIE